MELIIITRDGKDITVSREDYITAKHLDLVESFSTLTREGVAEMVGRILRGESSSGIIRAYIMDDDPRPA